MAICAHIYSCRGLVQRPVAQEYGHFVPLKTVLATSGPLGVPLIVFRWIKKNGEILHFFISVNSLVNAVSDFCNLLYVSDDAYCISSVHETL